LEGIMRLGLDIGTNSIGWWLFAQDSQGNPVQVINGGARVFADGRDPKSKASLAADRRAARAMRRRRDRYLRRRTVLMERLAAAGLMPVDPVVRKALEKLDPYKLRTKGLDHALTMSELGRAIFHLNQRRGFKSNRKTDRNDNESGKIASGAARLEHAIIKAGARTYGEFLHQSRQTDDPRRTPAVRTRMTTLTLGGKPEEGYDFYPTRNLLEEEFNKLWRSQEKYHVELTDELHDTLFETIFYQRPLKAPTIGRCLFEEEERLPKAHPLFQRRILFETVNALRIREAGQPDRPLTLDERDTLILQLDSKNVKGATSANVSFIQMRRALKLGTDETFSHETQNRRGIDCDRLRALLSHPERLGGRWSGIETDAQWTLVQKLRDTENATELEAWLMAELGLSEARAMNVANTPLPEGYGRIGLTATRKILELLKAEVITYDKAASEIYGDHRGIATGEILDELPYYGEILDKHVIPGTSEPEDDDITRFGRITNPTVHIGLNQIRRLVNKIIEVHGKPDEIVVELARELKHSEDQKREINKSIRKNTDAAIERGKKLEGLGQRNSGANRLILRLWEGLNPDVMDRRCPYTGTKISISMLFNGSCEVDHILPYSRTLDDSVANRTLCMRTANREKGNKTPWEAWGHIPERWAKIAPLIKRLHGNQQWRYAPDAMEKYGDEAKFLDRQLVDTQYLSRIAREYLSRLYPTEESRVWVTPGRLTEMLRRHWGLNSLLGDHNLAKPKNRHDHRHHAIDAAVIAVTDRSLINRISKMAGRNENLEDATHEIAPPWKSFRNDLKKQLDQITVSHRADHGRIDFNGRSQGRDSTSGQLHNDTAYGFTGEEGIVVTRKPLLAIKPADIGRIRDPDLQAQLYQETAGLEGKGFEAALAKFAAKTGPYQGIRRVRLSEKLKTIPIRDRHGKAYKGYKGDSNHCIEVWRLPDGKWKAELLTTYDAHQYGLGSSRPHPAAGLLMRLFKKDVVQLEHPDRGHVTVSIAKISAARLDLAPLNEANTDARSRSKDDTFDYLRIGLGTFQKRALQKVHVDEIGRIKNTRARER
jgi:CRISPR-associated endonuclease Csn1